MLLCLLCPVSLESNIRSYHDSEFYYCTEIDDQFQMADLGAYVKETLDPSRTDGVLVGFEVPKTTTEFS